MGSVTGTAPVAAMRWMCAWWLALAFVAAGSGVATAAPGDDLRAFKAAQEKTIALADRLVAATVSIIPSDDIKDLEESGEGSGVIVSADGLILTAAHVVEEMGKHVVVVLGDGRHVKADVLGSMKLADAAMLKITEPGQWPHAEVGDSRTLKAGDWCLATGHGGGYQKDRTAPLRLGRVLHVGDGANSINGIRTDAMIIFGDSGGPLFDLEGKVIGINSNTTNAAEDNGHVPTEVFRQNWDTMLAGSPDEAPKKRHPNRAKRRRPAVETQVPAETLNGFWRMVHLMQRKLAEGDAELKAMAGGSGDLTKLKPKQVAQLADRWQDELRAPAQADVKRGDESPESKRLFARLLQIAGRSDDLWDAIAAVDNSESKTHGEVLSELADLTKPAAAYTVSIERNGRPGVFGIVVDKRGYILTKASELRGKIAVRIGERRLAARTVATNEADDLALLKVDAEDLTAAPLADADPVRGTWLVSADAAGKPTALGIVSVQTRPIPRFPMDWFSDPNRAGLGIAADEKAKAAKIGRVTSQSPAQTAGLKPGDVITAVDGEEVGSFADLADTIGDHQPGDEVKITYQRKGNAAETTVKLGRADELAGDLDDPQVVSVSGGKASLSRRRSDFVAAFTHDSVLHANRCGGPVLDLDGRVVAVNIARVDRSTSYAIPTGKLIPILKQMIPQ